MQLGGEYRLTLHRADGETRAGTATIRQMRGSSLLDISGEVVSRTTPPGVTFSSQAARLNGSELLFIYENSRNERGIGVGHIGGDRPAAFMVSYYDVTNSDKNLDLQGQMVFTRTTKGED